jgi:hypothetical protein
MGRTHLSLGHRPVPSTSGYLKHIVEPTFEDFKRNPRSIRHAYIACAVAYHAIDYAAYPKKPGNLAKKWKKANVQFAIIEMIALKLKHVVSDAEKYDPAEGIPLSALVFGFGTVNTSPMHSIPLHEGGMHLHNLFSVIRDAINFMQDEAAKLEQSEARPEPFAQ